MPPKLPRIWTDEELKANRDLAEELFKKERHAEGPGAFESIVRETAPVIRHALDVTDDLRHLTGAVLGTHPAMWHALRYFCGPPVSEEDLWTMVGKKFKNLPPDIADAVASAISLSTDKIRMPWLAEGRTPTRTEREAAALATTVLMAHEKFRTQRRRTASSRQEGAVLAALESAGYVRDQKKKPILALDELPRGSFSRERKVDGAKCDVPVRLRDGRLLALECKVSNGPKNSWKRLNREVGGKAERWSKEFGAQVVTGAVLAGVFDLSCVVSAQRDQAVFLFWQHDLSSLYVYLEEIV